MKRNNIFFLVVLSALLFFGCRDNKQNSSNVFYVNYTCKNDTLLDVLKKATSGKATYYDNNKNLQIVPVTYLTEDHPNTHYFKITEELPAKPEPNTIKYEISFNESMINDSINYSFKKYIYRENGWQPRSDMGVLKVFNYASPRDKILKVVNKRVAANVLKLIISDTYEKKKNI